MTTPTAVPVALVLAWEAAEEDLVANLPELLLDILRAHERQFAYPTVSLSIGLHANAEAIRAVTKDW